MAVVASGGSPSSGRRSSAPVGGTAEAGVVEVRRPPAPFFDDRPGKSGTSTVTSVSSTSSGFNAGDGVETGAAGGCGGCCGDGGGTSAGADVGAAASSGETAGTGVGVGAGFRFVSVVVCVDKMELVRKKKLGKTR